LGKPQVVLLDRPQNQLVQEHLGPVGTVRNPGRADSFGRFSDVFQQAPARVSLAGVTTDGLRSTDARAVDEPQQCVRSVSASLIEGVPELELSEIKRSGKSADAVPAPWLAVREKRSSNSYRYIQKEFMLPELRDTLNHFLPAENCGCLREYCRCHGGLN
jgi:hypothetical protein